MIARLIDSCIRNRGVVMLLTVLMVAGGIWSAVRINVDAIPDLSDIQVIIRTDYPGQAPQIVEDQVTYPLTTSMLAVPQAKVVRGYSLFGTSFVYIIFDDGTDLYWARSRVLEQLNFVSGLLPVGVSPRLGPDATGVGWIFQYVLVTGDYCPDHPGGLWHDPAADIWYADGDAAPAGSVHHRVFEGLQRCPLDGGPLVPSDQDLSDLRGLQDWYLRFELTAVEGVSEVAAIGGFVKQYQVVVDPVRLLAYNMPLSTIRTAIKRSNVDVGGRLLEISETEYMVRGSGYLGALDDAEIAAARAAGRSIEDLRTERVLEQLAKVALVATPDGKPVYLGDVADIRIGPDIRRGLAEWNGIGEVVGGIIVMRFGGNAQTTIQRVRDRLFELEKGLPPGVAIEIGYDRSDLIERAIGNLRLTLVEEMGIVALVIVVFLIHARSALVALFVLPTGVLMSLAAMHLLDINANIMSLGGIAIAIGVMVDSSIVMVENAHKHLQREADSGAEPRPRTVVVAEAAREVGPSLFFALLIITVSFLPIFALADQSGRLFKPLAYTKTFAMAAAAILSITALPVLMSYLVCERVLPRTLARPVRLLMTVGIVVIPAVVLAVVPLPNLDAWRGWLVAAWVVLALVVVVPQRLAREERLPAGRLLTWIFAPVFHLAMRFRWVVVVVATALVVSALWPLNRLGSEFMPPLEEGDLLYMPTTDPGISITKARDLLQQTDKLIMTSPEVKSVMGKIGRAETATDPAPLSMVETTITLHRDKDRWRRMPLTRFFDSWPGFLRAPLQKLWPASRPITLQELVYGFDFPDGTHVPGLNETIQIPGLTNAWTQPIQTRIDMLSTGIRTPVGIKVMGPDLSTLAELSNRIAQVVKTDDATRRYTTSAFAEKSVGGKYLDIEIDRDAIARYGLHVADVQDVIMSALGGMNVSVTVEGLERYPINLRYPAELRDNIPALRQTLVATPLGAQVPLGQLAEFVIHEGPPMIKSENARLTSWVYVDISGIDIGTYVANAQRAVAAQVDLPPGYSIVWSGQYEYMQAARQRLMAIVPVVGVLIVLLLYASTRSWVRVFLVLTTIPMSVVGSFWLLDFLDYNMSVAVWVGLIALAGLEVETGLVMLLYLDTSVEQFRQEGRLRSPRDLRDAVTEGAVSRIRPVTMTELTTFIALVPLLWADGAGADTMRRLAAPMVGGVVSGYVAILLVLPILYYLVGRVSLARDLRRDAQQSHR